MECISWLPHGRGFIIKDKKRFAAEVLPKYFGESKYTSFTRRLNRWYFTIQAHGHKKASYYHPQFIRGDTRSCQEMIPAPQRKNSRAKKALAAARASSPAPPRTISIPLPVVTDLVPSNEQKQLSYSKPPLQSYLSTFNSDMSVRRPDASNVPLPSSRISEVPNPYQSHLMGSQLFQEQYSHSLQHVYAVHQAELARAQLMSRHALERVMLESTRRFSSFPSVSTSAPDIDFLRLTARQMKSYGVTSFSQL